MAIIDATAMIGIGIRAVVDSPPLNAWPGS